MRIGPGVGKLRLVTNNSNGRRVVVTGMGFITPIGNDLETVWSNMVEGVSGIGQITHFDTTNFDTKIAGEVKGDLVFLTVAQACE